MDKETAIAKIRKCMALAKSGEPHEAAAALRQAQKLMQQFGVDHPELLAAGAAEEWAKSCATRTPPRYEVVLASMVSGAFYCDIMFSRQLNKSGNDIDGGYSFIGIAPMPEAATYAFTVLRRQLIKARGDYIKTALRRYRKNKTAAADQFCEGWVSAVRNLVSRVYPSAEEAAAISAYKAIHYAQTTSLQPRRRDTGQGGANMAHRVNGYVEGQNAQLHHGVGGSAPTGLLGA